MPEKDIQTGGYIYPLRRARKTFSCKMGDGDIVKGELYYAVSIAGGGLRSLKFPDPIHERCQGRHAQMIIDREKKRGEHGI
jgi:hypothetical protein